MALNVVKEWRRSQTRSDLSVLEVQLPNVIKKLVDDGSNCSLTGRQGLYRAAPHLHVDDSRPIYCGRLNVGEHALVNNQKWRRSMMQSGNRHARPLDEKHVNLALIHTVSKS
jgi:hypothetical protein